MLGGRPSLSLVAVPVLAGLGVLQWWVGLAPVLIVVAGYVALVGALSHPLPLRIALSAAFLLQNAGYLALVLVLPYLTSGAIRPGVALATLAVPCLAVVPDVVLRRRAVTTRPSTRPSLLLVGCAAIGGLVMIVVALLVGRGDPFASVAWTASGDARFHLLFIRDVLAEGGLHGRAFTYQPQYQEALTALLADTHGRRALAPGELLQHDLHVLAQVSIALTVTWSLATTAMLLGFGRLKGRTPAAAVAIASLLPLTGIALGVVLRDGFLPVLLLVPLLLATVTMLSWLQVATDGRGATWAVGVTAAALAVLAFTWTPFAVVVGCAALPPWWRSIRSSRGRTRTSRLALMTGGVVASASYTVVVLANSLDFVEINGSIASPAPPTTILVPLLVLLIAAGGWSAVRAPAFIPYLAGTAATAAITVSTILIQPEGVIWGYFPSKLPWIWTLVGLTMLLLPFAHPARPSGTRRSRAVLAGGAASVLVAATALSPLTSPLLPARLAWLQSGPAPSGTMWQWAQPTADSLRLAVSLGDRRERYVVYQVSPVDDRLTNFWLAPYDAVGDREFFLFSVVTANALPDICTLLATQPDRIVVTADPTAADQFAEQCGLTDVRIRLLD